MKQFKDWEHILLDTGIIFGLFSLRANPKVNREEYHFSKYLLEYLINNKAGSGKKRSFYVSAISISEILIQIGENRSTIQRIMDALEADIEIVGFDAFIAEYIVSNYFKVLGAEKIKSIAKELGYPNSEYKMIREWINRDTMIIGTCDFMEFDTVFTFDKNTFLPQAISLNVPCTLVNKDFFNFSSVMPELTLFSEEPNYQFTITFKTRTNVEFTTKPQMGYSTC